MFNRMMGWIKPLIIFYILVAYIAAAFVWWMVLHFRNAAEIRDLSIVNAELVYKLNKLDPGHLHNPNPRYANTDKEDALSGYESNRKMIVSEGLVFFLIILLGTYQVHAGVLKEYQLSRQQRNFLLSITHELKSPLASIRLSIETLLNRLSLDVKFRQRLLANSLKDTTRLKNLVDNILMAAKIENRSISLIEDDIDFSRLVQGMVTRIQETQHEFDRLDVEVQEDILVNGDTTALTSIVINLIENALKYSGKEDKVMVTLKANPSGKKAVLRVADTGIGIDKQDKKKIFEKFYRVGNEDTRKTKGTGLGLFLVKQLVEKHNGNIKVEDNLPRGTVFVVSLPCEVLSPELETLV